jgi:hypothetical protein
MHKLVEQTAVTYWLLAVVLQVLQKDYAALMLVVYAVTYTTE